PIITKNEIKKKLYLSHFLYVWNARVYEFGIILLIVDLYPNTLFPSSLFALCLCLSGIFFSATIAKIIDNGERLKTVKRTIFLQRISVLISISSLLLVKIFEIESTKISKFITLCIVIICGSIEKLCAIGNKIAISRDWLVKISNQYESVNENFLVELNTQMRSIDLFCKLVGPTFIATLNGFSTKISAFFIIISILISNPVEIYAIVNVYNNVSELQIPKVKFENNEVDDDDHNDLNKINSIQFFKNLKIFQKSVICLPTISYSLLYLTSLSFGSATIAYLLSFEDIDSFKIGILRGASTIFEFSSTFLFPFILPRIGIIKMGLISIISEFLFLLPIAISFIMKLSYCRWLICILIPFSRIGLWCYDLTAQNLIQLYVNDSDRGSFSSIEESLINFFELLSCLLTLIFNKQEQFAIPVYCSVGAI
ncbi:hypothetical protein PACTADRAFT_26386, partial [Pachysolen tannophilus NRRL Y-2460]